MIRANKMNKLGYGESFFSSPILIFFFKIKLKLQVERRKISEMFSFTTLTNMLITMATLTTSGPASLTKPYTLELPVLLPITGNIYPLGQVGLEPVRMIAEIVNNRSDILPDYNVVIDVIDDQCDAATGLNRTVGPFFLQEQAIFNNTNRIGRFQFPENFEIQQETANSF